MAPKTIKGKASIPGFNTDLDVDVLDDQYEAYDKELPKNLPKETGNKETITWFNNFGVNGPTSSTNPKKLKKAYKVTIQKAPARKTLCIYDDTQATGSEILILSPTAGSGRIAYTENNNGTVSFYLDLVDPPTGYYP
jgi:hypothetical protein